MRQTEITEGVDLRDKDGNKVCKSTYAAKKGITQVNKMWPCLENVI